MQATIDGSEAFKTEACKGYGSKPAKIMLVGISAGKLGALQTEVPFTKDMSGRLFQRALFQIGLSKTADEKTLKPELVNCYVTNLVKGRILNDKGNNRLPTPSEIAYWIPVLQKEIDEVNPKVIIALGDLVWKAMTYHNSRGELTFNIGTYLRKGTHPRAYGSRGAISTVSPKGKAAFEKMVREYRGLIEP